MNVAAETNLRELFMIAKTELSFLLQEKYFNTSRELWFPRNGIDLKKQGKVYCLITLN